MTESYKKGSCKPVANGAPVENVAQNSDKEEESQLSEANSNTAHGEDSADADVLHTGRQARDTSADTDPKENIADVEVFHMCRSGKGDPCGV